MTVSETVYNSLELGLKKLKLDISIEPLLNYLSLLNKWNQAYNLTAIRNMQDMVALHLLDSLAILPWLEGTQIIDVGTGAGLPGIPLAIARPDLNFTLIDSNGKKIRFLNEVKRQLNLENVQIIQSRLEDYRPIEGFDTVTSRAFSDLNQMIKWSQHLIRPDAIWLAMKGKYPESELINIDFPYTIESYEVPGIEGERCCVIIQNSIQ